MIQQTTNMEGVKIYKEQECIDLIIQIDELFRFLFDSKTITYTYYIKHLTEDSYLVVIDKDRISHLAIKFKSLFNQLPYKLEDIKTVNKYDYINKDLELI